MSKKTIKKMFGEITWAILEVIARAPEAIVSGFLDHRSIEKKLDDELVADKLLKYLRNLKKSNYIETEMVNGSLSVRLTTKGKIKNLENPSNGIVDGKIRGISYDIPELYKSKRQALCRSLKRIGYKQLQKSMWICLYSKADQIDLIIDDLNLNDYVAYFVIEKSNIDSHISELFA